MRPRLGAMALVAGLAGMIGVACSPPPRAAPTLRRFELTSHEWLTVTSPHFTVMTDLPADNARVRVIELEQVFTALADHYRAFVPEATAPTERLPVIYMRSCADFKYVAGPRILGLVAPMPDFLRTRTMLTCDFRTWDLRREVVVHELSHLFTRHVLGEVPRWVHEGLASYFETMVIEEGNAVVGATRQRKKHWPRKLAYDALVAQDLDAIRREGMAAFYLGAWSMMHLLAQDHREVFITYLRALAAGDGHDKAWSALVARLGLERLRNQYAAYDVSANGHSYATPFVYSRETAVETAKMRRGEAHAVWIRIQLFVLGVIGDRAAPWVDDVRAHLDAIDREDPTWPGRHFWRAAFAHHLRAVVRDEEAPVVLLRRYVDEHKDEAGLAGLVAVQLEARVPPWRLGTEESAAPNLDGVAADVEALRAVARTGPGLNLVAWYHALRREPALALPFAERAVSVDAGCVECAETLAVIHHQLGNAADALKWQERAMNRLLDRDPSRNMIERLQLFRRAAAR